MAKVADKYYKVDPWSVIEEGFEPLRNRVSESIFSLGNEYMGVRGYQEEGYSGDSLIGSYFNGLYDEMKLGAHYKGIIRSLRFMANAVDWLYTRIKIDDELLDIATSTISGFIRKLDFKSGVLTRELTWHLKNGYSVKISFIRFVSMTNSHLGCQRVVISPLDFSGRVEVRTGLDFATIHEDQGKNLWLSLQKTQLNGQCSIMAKTLNTDNRLFSSFKIHTSENIKPIEVKDEQFIGLDFNLSLTQGEVTSFDKIVVNYADKTSESSALAVWSQGIKLASKYCSRNFNDIYAEQVAYWSHIWDTSDITIDGDPENQQGIRFCIFQLYQTYHGDNPGLNIGAKGLTGEAYRGLAFWDTESYCLPFYIFNNPKAARSLLEFRYKTLSAAMERAKEMDCEGASYPIATIDGTESCDLWQHSNLQLHVGSAIAYGIWHYTRIVGDIEFIHTQGIEILIQMSRFYATRGQWGQRSGEFGYYGVMGPDEFQLMVNNNCYLNLMAKKLFEYTLEVIEDMRNTAPNLLDSLLSRLVVNEAEIAHWGLLASKMRIPLDPITGVYEEHDGFFDMPHIDIHSIPVTDFPLYSNWSYDRLYRYDMIKQPDVLMFMFLHNQSFSLEAKRANYDYYEPRCIHESSLSPSIHSILAAELGKQDEAYNFFEFATRLDLDNYNRNTKEGLHTTSIAAAWMNIVYGFGGMRSDGDGLIFKPTLPSLWNSYSFKIIYQNSVLQVAVDRENIIIKTLSGSNVDITIYSQSYSIGSLGIQIQREELISYELVD
ncbi:family 65 glycosyl hydrolase [Paenibacillus psychroresistens]|uniref:Family 65 glycosyl hydrolase n=1 Tax=Paenibacillus psychroresistens TaxID=1778678 RepID=A0A6B8RDU4_9BACL|nr:glycosyl hydrolase family 65 protein [Paenibacillus psychroresistens]QGQ94379.1 family 65 glycosyl hydrolase [Paenibacillus psychroresistens]